MGSEWKGNGRSAGEQLPQRNGSTSMASGTIVPGDVTARHPMELSQVGRPCFA